ncbi:MAG: ATP-binding protein [Candidatus Omnitrophica bacterium]|jgi:signal transduction histidine kinase|nr:ATP-binding protein [Candidatus Omnitrophota bacterium]
MQIYRLDTSYAEVLPQAQDPGASRINELTRSFVKGTLRSVMKAVDAESGALFLFDKNLNRLVLDSFQGKAVPGPASGRPSAWKKFFSVPLFVEGRLFGLMKIGIKSDGTAFSGSDISFSNALCGHACRIVEDQMNFADMRSEISRLSQKKSELEKYSKVGKLACGIAGRISSPLDGALRYCRLVLSHMDNSPKQHEYLEFVRQGLDRITDITSSLLKVGKDGPSAQAVGDPVDLHSLLDESLEVFGSFFNDSTRVTPNYAGPLSVYIDKSIVHVFTNLIKNALDAMPCGGELEIATQIKQAGLQVIFRDSGCGISQDVQAKIFEPFYTTKPSGSGSGLGLSICRDIIAKFGGRIGVKSSPGQGSTFTILLPKNILA